MAQDESKQNPQGPAGGEEEQQEPVAAPGEIPPGLLPRCAEVDETRPEQKGSYGFKGGLIAIVDNEGRVYLTPGTRLKLDVLQQAGFNKPKPQIEVPFSDGTPKSKRWLRRNMPKNEIKRTVKENQLPKLEGKVYAAAIKVHLEGLKPLPPDFLEQRCAMVEDKYYINVGMSASFRGILSFTDMEVNTWVTPYSDFKKELLERHGYVFVESMIQVPYSLDDPENRLWLARNVPADEWERTEKEIEENRRRKQMEKAKEKIEVLGLEELPEDLLACSARSEESYPDYAGMVGSHNGILSFTDPAGNTYVTPATKQKVERLRGLNYQFMGSGIRVPYSLKTNSDIEWLKKNIAPEHWEQARRENEAEADRLEQEQAEKRQRSLGLTDLPAEFIERCIRTDTRQAGFAGQYYIRNNVLGFVEPSGMVMVTPVTRQKIRTLEESNYQQANSGFRVPYSDNTQEDWDYIRRQLSMEEIRESEEERMDEKQREEKERIQRSLERRKLKKLPDELMERSARTGERDIDQIGVFCSRNNVTCFVFEDGYYHVTPTVPWKEQVLKDSGYSQPEQLIRVPYGSGSDEDRLWLNEHLPEGELERSAKELEELEQENEEKKIRRRIEQLGIGDRVPEELGSRSACTEETNKEQIGHYMVMGDLLAFVGPDANVWLTPNTPSKVKLLEDNNYVYATRRFVVPHASNVEIDQAWRRQNLPEGEIERSMDELRSIEDSKEDELARDIAGKRMIKELDSSFLERCASAGKVSAQGVGAYLQRGEMLFFVAPDREAFITPATADKTNVLTEAGYHYQPAIKGLPHASDSEEDREWILENLPEGELERSREESSNAVREEQDEKVRDNMEKHNLKTLPEELTDRCAFSGQLDPENVGRQGLYRGVMAFVMPDERVMVAWYSPEKEEKLDECGYKLEGRMPIKVPFAMPDPGQRQWLMENLPEPDEEEEISVEENAEGL